MSRTLSIDPESALAKTNGTSELLDDPLIRFFQEHELVEVFCVIDQDGDIATGIREFGAMPWDTSFAYWDRVVESLLEGLYSKGLYSILKQLHDLAEAFRNAGEWVRLDFQIKDLKISEYADDLLNLADADDAEVLKEWLGDWAAD